MHNRWVMYTFIGLLISQTVHVTASIWLSPKSSTSHGEQSDLWSSNRFLITVGGVFSRTSDSIIQTSPSPTPGSRRRLDRNRRYRSPSRRCCWARRTPLRRRLVCSWGSSGWTWSCRSRGSWGACRRTGRRDSSGQIPRSRLRETHTDGYET